MKDKHTHIVYCRAPHSALYDPAKPYWVMIDAWGHLGEMGYTALGSLDVAEGKRVVRSKRMLAEDTEIEFRLV